MTQTVLLGDIVDTVIDYRGKTPKKLGGDWSIAGYRALSAKNIENGKIKNAESIRYIDELLYKKWMKEEVKRGDVLLTSEAPLGQSLLWDSDEKIVLSQRLFGIRARKDIVDPNFLYAYISSPIYQAELEARATGSTVRGIRQAELMKTRLFLPPLDQQKKIGDFVRAIDEKIELNRKMNETLEQMGQALFRHYFIDNPEVTQWEIGTLDDLFSVTMGQSPPGLSYNEISEGITFYQGRAEFGVRFPNKRLSTIDPKRLAKAGDVLLSVRAPVGDINQATEKCCVGRGLAAISSKTNQTSFCYYSCLNIQNELMKYNSEGTVFGSINGKQLKSIKVSLPPGEVIARFEEWVGAIDEQILNNSKQIETLTALRDTLLPRLISGKVEL